MAAVGALRKLERAVEGEMRAILHDVTDWGPEDQRALVEYLAAHHTLPEFPELVPEEEVLADAKRLEEETVMSEEQAKRILVLLAHHKSRAATDALERYLRRADPDLRTFAMLALDEARQWTGHVKPGSRCPCGSGRKYRKCCGRGDA